MTPSEFVLAIEDYVLSSAVESTMENLRSPPGRRVPAGAAARSAWFNSLPAEQARMLREVVNDAAQTAVFGMLAVLDGARIVDDEKGRFELYYTGEQRTLINPEDTDLHDLMR